MLVLSNAVSFAALQVGVILISAALWLGLRRETRRSRLVRSFQAMLDQEELERAEDKNLKRAA